VLMQLVMIVVRHRQSAANSRCEVLTDHLV